MSAARRGFVTGGTWCVDYNLLIDTWPHEESATRILSNSVAGGGSACNFAVDMRQLAPEIPVSTIGQHGADAEGEVLRAIASDYGIDMTQLCCAPDMRTHRTYAFTAGENGKRTHIFDADSSDRLTPDHFDFSASTAWMLHLGLPGTHRRLDQNWQDDANGWVTILRKARAAGLKTNMELMTIPKAQLHDLVLPCLPLLDFLVVNDYEIGALTGIDTLPDGTTSVAAVKAAAHRVIALGAMETVAVHFPGGAIAIERDGTLHSHPSVDMPRSAIVGSNGAGDAFAAGFFCGLHRQQPLRDCLAYAHAAAAASLRTIETYSGLDTIETCLALAHGHGWHEELRD